MRPTGCGCPRTRPSSALTTASWESSPAWGSPLLTTQREPGGARRKLISMMSGRGGDQHRDGLGAWRNGILVTKNRPVDKLCPGKRLCRMEWERARKKDAVWRQKELVSSFLSLMRSRKGGSGLPLPLFLAGKARPDCSPISARQMSPRSRSAVCAALFWYSRVSIHQYPPGSLSKIIALNMFGSAFPNALRPHQADIAIRLFRIVNPPQPSGQPSRFLSSSSFPCGQRYKSFPHRRQRKRDCLSHRPLVSLSRAAHKIEYYWSFSTRWNREKIIGGIRCGCLNGRISRWICSIWFK